MNSRERRKQRRVVAERGFGPRHAFNAQEGSEAVPGALPEPPPEELAVRPNSLGNLRPALLAKMLGKELGSLTKEDVAQMAVGMLVGGEGPRAGGISYRDPARLSAPESGFSGTFVTPRLSPKIQAIAEQMMPMSMDGRYELESQVYPDLTPSERGELNVAMNRFRSMLVPDGRATEIRGEGAEAPTGTAAATKAGGVSGKEEEPFQRGTRSVGSSKVAVERGFGPRHSFNAAEGSELVPEELPTPPAEELEFKRNSLGNLRPALLAKALREELGGLSKEDVAKLGISLLIGGEGPREPSLPPSAKPLQPGLKLHDPAPRYEGPHEMPSAGPDVPEGPLTPKEAQDMQAYMDSLKNKPKMQPEENFPNWDESHGVKESKIDDAVHVDALREYATRNNLSAEEYHKLLDASLGPMPGQKYTHWLGEPVPKPDGELWAEWLASPEGTEPPPGLTGKIQKWPPEEPPKGQYWTDKLMEWQKEHPPSEEPPLDIPPDWPTDVGQAGTAKFWDRFGIKPPPREEPGLEYPRFKKGTKGVRHNPKTVTGRPRKIGVERGYGPRHAANAREGDDLTSINTDTVPAMLTPREAVLNRNAAELAGRDQIEQLNEQGNELAKKGVDLAAGGDTDVDPRNLPGRLQDLYRLTTDPAQLYQAFVDQLRGTTDMKPKQLQSNRRPAAAAPKHSGGGGFYPPGQGLYAGGTTTVAPIGDPTQQQAYGPPIQLSSPDITKLLQQEGRKQGLNPQQIAGLAKAFQGFGGGGMDSYGEGSQVSQDLGPALEGAFGGGYQGGISDIGYPPMVGPNMVYHGDKGGWLGGYDPNFMFTGYYARGTRDVSDAGPGYFGRMAGGVPSFRDPGNLGFNTGPHGFGRPSTQASGGDFGGRDIDRYSQAAGGFAWASPTQSGFLGPPGSGWFNQGPTMSQTTLGNSGYPRALPPDYVQSPVQGLPQKRQT